MSDIRFKDALSNLDPNTRICILHLDRQIKEIRVKPLKALSKLKNDVLKTLSEIEENNKKWEKITDDLYSIDDTLTTEYWEDLKTTTVKEVKDTIEKIFHEHIDILKENKILFDKRIKMLDEGYEKFEKLFAGKSYLSEAGMKASMKKKKIR